jgi:hypothetical protein
MKTKPFVVRQVGALVLALLAVAAFAAAQPIGGYYTAESIANLRRNCGQYPGIIFSRSFPSSAPPSWPLPAGLAHAVWKP